MAANPDAWEARFTCWQPGALSLCYCLLYRPLRTGTEHRSLIETLAARALLQTPGQSQIYRKDADIAPTQKSAKPFMVC